MFIKASIYFTGANFVKVTKNKIILVSVFFLALYLAGLIMIKKISPVGFKIWGETNTSSGVAIKGYDPVSYQTINKASLGSHKFKLNWHGADWHFVNQENKTLFEQSPTQYAPQYGGYCSFAVSKGVTADIDPKVWHIENNKLYLFMDKDVKHDWVKDKSITKSDENWSDN